MTMMKRLTVIASLALVAAAVMAAPAVASLKWSSTGGFTLKGNLTLKKNGLNSVNCNLSMSLAAKNEGTKATFGPVFTKTTTVCSNGGSAEWTARGEVKSEGGGLYFEALKSYEGWKAPWGGEWNLTGIPPLTNGSGATATHVDFSETEIGYTGFFEPVTATGKLELYKSTGLLTVISY
jgi:hypothetical protein